MPVPVTLAELPVSSAAAPRERRGVRTRVILGGALASLTVVCGMLMWHLFNEVPAVQPDVVPAAEASVGSSAWTAPAR